MLRTVPKPIFLALAALFLGSLACQAVSFTADTPNSAPAVQVETAVPPASLPDVAVEPSAPSVTSPLIPDLVAQQGALVDIYQRLSPGVVSIQVLSNLGGGQGSGFVVDSQGHVVTNFHVVEGAEDIEVHFPSGFKTRGQMIGQDLDSDLAVIDLEALPEGLQPLPLGDSDRLQVGQTVVAIGNPFGLDGTMTVGIVSALGRTLDSLRASPGGQFFSAGDIVQTDAAINPGNSGGPLLNLSGEVIGINRAIRTENFTVDGSATNTGIGFAVPVNIVKRVLPSLIAEGAYSYPYLGISSLPVLNLHTAEALDLPRSTGAYVTDVTPGSPADAAGLVGATRPTGATGLNSGGDLIIAIDGRPVLEFSDMLTYLLNNKSPGDQVLLTVLRSGETLELPLVLGERP
jgi:2-alkenal reductase